MSPHADTFDVAVVGAGPGGLSAALVLGRCRRRVVLLDDGRPRNARAAAVHGFLSREGVAPGELRRIAREQLAPYAVEVRDARVTSARRREGAFELDVVPGGGVRAAKLVLATGMEDTMPEIPGLAALVGTHVFYCPYCDGWEVRDRPLALLGEGAGGAEAALGLRSWSDDVTLLASELDPAVRGRLARNGVRVQEAPVARVDLDGAGGCVVAFAGAPPRVFRALFIHAGQHQRSSLPATLGCAVGEGGTLRCEGGQTSVPGVYAVGDAAGDIELAILAAAEGALAAHAINTALRREGEQP